MNRRIPNGVKAGYQGTLRSSCGQFRIRATHLHLAQQLQLRRPQHQPCGIHRSPTAAAHHPARCRRILHRRRHDRARRARHLAHRPTVSQRRHATAAARHPQMLHEHHAVAVAAAAALPQLTHCAHGCVQHPHCSSALAGRSDLDACVVTCCDVATVVAAVLGVRVLPGHEAVSEDQGLYPPASWGGSEQPPEQRF